MHTMNIPWEPHTPEEAMDIALTAARKGVRGANPLVGAVITSPDGYVLHVGYHRGAGTPHAEADAIAQANLADTDLSDTTMYVTLEPCNHIGRTGPCSRAIAQAGISKVVYAHPDMSVAAGGADYLRSQGIEVEQGLRQSESYELNARWFAAAAAQRPFVTAKIASTLDGFIAASDGTSKWITGPGARAAGHTIRARADAVMVGTGTAEADNPALTARDEIGNPLERQPLRVVMGTREVPADALVCRGEGFVHLRTRDPRVALDELYAMGVRHLMIEGGPIIISAFLRESLVDELFWYQAPILLGAGAKAVSDVGITTLTDACRWQLDELGMAPAVNTLGNDTRMHLIPAPHGAPTPL
ncbi:bifunctional diaminohydroxyphosphoribosylaminopyrimidine deaminase/5-amino-6-(5-phosphoribosylamino)uracil reductase RibD [Rothia sp. ZJ932]|uniref:bifunctional diaminohydroxyphosphoribosylaminopyrimidine deaminase/5-amino-6-(5-phosphoribosylamino)uracil reductase RibD n=1 Tax=Rothia sp. ZJ932 TaxID=2810516 RepID=UPI001966DD92|nr:bifunctional diaminohydroxyphosphoribosylaminopyrimidine deaminase/5-amino-6-(5-phosphoribosylamino)uracil reductase RibD [Rothia sp. ZJ932]QRZ60861.1 bifunctional diaminohydroxyphosphoribosylaminopyrimidine deaminase/5-amino-6-(5-phosphoribosylamino)uracil reductase RibD [Rothia sp. ZJ932]